MNVWNILRPTGPGPKYQSICDLLAAAIDRGDLEHGRPLPSHRALAEHLRVSVGTVTRAYEEAMKRGLIEGEIGRGTHVRHGSPMPLTVVEGSRIPSGCLDMYQNFPVEVPEIEHPAWRDAMGRLRRRVDLARLARQSWSQVSRRSQRSGQTWMRRIGFDAPLSGIFECPGTQSALVALVNAATTPGDVLLAPALSHPGIRLIAEQHGLKLHGLAMDEDGITADSFNEACLELEPKLLYLPPTLHSPTTITMPLQRRQEIAEIAIRHNVVILEDESSAFFFDDPPTPMATLAPEHTFFVADLWMALSLGLRTTYVSVPQRFIEPVSIAVAATCGVTPPMLSEIAAIWIRTDTAENLIEARKKELRARNMIAQQVLKRRTVHAHPMSHHLWLLLPSPWRADLYVARAERRGVAINGADWFYIGDEARPEAVRVSLGNVTHHDHLRDALETLDRLIDQPDRPPTGPTI